MAEKNVPATLKPLVDKKDNLFRPTAPNEHTAVEIPIDLIDDNPDNPFRVRDDNEMETLSQSIQKIGVQNAVLVREKENGHYELIAGHRRKQACIKAGKNTLPVLLRNVDDDTANLIMVDTNLENRENILPSERAFAYKIKMEAMNRQGQRTCGHDVHKSKARDEIGEQIGLSGRQISSYIRLTNLIPDIMQMVDDGIPGVTVAFELASLQEDEQRILYDLMRLEEKTPTLSQAQQLKTLSEKNLLDYTAALAILKGHNIEMTKEKVITVKGEFIRQYFPPGSTEKEIGRVITLLIKHNKDNIPKLIEKMKAERER